MTDPKLTAVRKNLLADWRAFVAQRTLDFHGDCSREPLFAWVGALVDAAVEARQDSPKLQAAVRGAFAEGAKALQQPGFGGPWYDPHGYQSRRGLHPIARLTLDLAAGDQLKSSAPTLYRLLRQTVGTERRKLDGARRGWFKKFGGAQVNNDALEFWRKHIGAVVPDPARCEYKLCVEWLSAARELDEACGDAILQGWARPTD